jgi:hypothetical protein
VTETEFALGSDLDSLRFRVDGSATEMKDDLTLVVVAEGRLPFNDTDARLRNFSNADDAAGEATLPGGARLPGGGAELFENISSAFIRFEIPEDTLTFLACITGAGLTDWLLLSTNVADIDRVSPESELNSLRRRLGLETARVCQASSGVRGSPSGDKGPLPTETGWAS